MVYSSQSDKVERYLQRLSTELIRNNINLSLRVEHLYYVLMRGFRDDYGHSASEVDSSSIISSQSLDERDIGERNWLVSRPSYCCEEARSTRHARLVAQFPKHVGSKLIVVG